VRTISGCCLQLDDTAADHQSMNSMACRAVAQAGLCAGTASLDDERPHPLLLLAGWLTTAADLMVEAALREAALA
jgi:hypothetical protein